MKNQYILPLYDVAASLNTVGGKGASLARLVRAGLPVPGGFHITTRAYRQFVHENNLQPGILEALAPVDLSSPQTLQTASQVINQLFMGGEIPQALADAIISGYAQISGNSPAVAVRSSATAEDLPEASFAGQQETYLNIRGADAVLEATKKCWASLWTARAIGYRARQEVVSEGVALAVVVQRMIPAAVAGIMFTANPLNGKRNEAVINAAWGLGEAIVGGQVTPDTFTVEKSSGAVISREVARKAVQTARTDSGVEQQPVPEHIQNSSSLTEEQAVELTRYGSQIEEMYGMPMDIEWTLTESDFAIVQARPITALPDPPLDWSPPDPKGVYLRTSAVDLMPDPLSPLFISLGLPALVAQTYPMTERITGSEPAFAKDYFTAINGYAYMNSTVPKEAMRWIFTGLLPSTMRIMRLLPMWRDEMLPEYQDKIDAYKDKSPGEMSANELWKDVQEILNAAMYYLAGLRYSTMKNSAGSEGILTTVYEKMAQQEGDPPAATLLMGYDSIPVKAEKALYDLAMWVKESDQLKSYILESSTEKLVQQTSNEGFVLWDEFESKLQAHLDRFGHIIYSLDFAEPLLREHPEPMLEIIKMYLRGKGTNPHKRQKNSEELRIKTTEAVLQRLKGFKLWAFTKALNYGQSNAEARDDALAYLGLGYPQLRTMLLELGQRLADAGGIQQKEDIFWLEKAEIEQSMPLLESGNHIESLSGRVNSRKSFSVKVSILPPPPVIPEKKRVKGMKTEHFVHGADVAQAGDSLSGVATSAGIVTAPASVLLSSADFGNMQPGNVLVAGTTTPAWTPLFAMASAVVTDVGGPLSHGSIVAREYGIPAVMGTGVGTKRIQNGQIITVDGTKGKVLLDVPDSSPDSDQAPPFEWALPNPKGTYVRASIVDLLPDPLSPLYLTLGIPTFKQQMPKIGRRLLGSTPVLADDYFTEINTYAYMNSAYPPKSIWWLLTGMLPAYPKLLKNLVPLWRDELHPEYKAYAAELESISPSQMSNAGIWAQAQEIVAEAMNYLCGIMFATMGASAGSEGLLTRVYEKMVQGEGDPSATVLLMGWDNISIHSEKSLYDMAMWCRENADLIKYIQETPATTLAEHLITGQIPTEIDREQWNELHVKFNHHLKQFGHIIYQMDFAYDLPLDHPEPMLEILKLYLSGEGTNPYERQRKNEEIRIQTSQEMLGRVKGLKSWIFRTAINWGQKMAAVREDAIAEIGLAFPKLRELLRELGSRFVSAEIIAERDDIFWLEKDEIDLSIANLESDKSVDKLAARVSERRDYWNRAKQETPPPMLPYKERMMGIKSDLFIAHTGEAQTGDTLKGEPTSVGLVTAPARILLGPKDFDQMCPGDVLVANTTTPAWTPLFSMAAAVVTDVGGPLSHGSIVAREFGIPAVMGTGVATKRIQSGQMITVDGEEGTVKIHNGE